MAPLCALWRGLEAILRNLDFDRQPAPTKGPPKRPCGGGNFFSNFAVGSPFGRIHPAFQMKSSSVLSGIPYFEKIGARRATRWGLCGVQNGAASYCTQGTSPHRGVPARIAGGQPKAAPGRAGHRRPGLTPTPARPGKSRCGARAASGEYGVQLNDKRPGRTGHNRNGCVSTPH